MSTLMSQPGQVYVCPILPEQINKTANNQKYGIDPEPLLHDQLAPDSDSAVGSLPTRLPK